MSQLSDVRSGAEQPSITTGDLTLRPWRPEDALQLIKAFGDPEIRAMHEVAAEDDEEVKAKEWICYWDEKWRAGTAAAWAITRASRPDVVLGQVALRALYLKDGMAECSYWVLQEHRGKGVAPRATRAMSEWAFREHDLYRLEIAHSVRNWRSCRVALKAGFPPESIKRSLQRLEDGKVHDMHLHALVLPADARARPLDRALLGIVSHTTLWTSASMVSAGAALLALVYRFAAVLPLMIAAGVLVLRASIVHGSLWQYRRRLSGRRETRPSGVSQ